MCNKFPLYIHMLLYFSSLYHKQECTNKPDILTVQVSIGIAQIFEFDHVQFAARQRSSINRGEIDQNCGVGDQPQLLTINFSYIYMSADTESFCSVDFSSVLIC